MKKVMVSFKRHQGPMHAVLSRAKIGKADKYGRGIWIGENDLPSIRAYFEKHGEPWGKENWWVDGTNIHNQVLYTDFTQLFAE